jgi:hypothetical protein
MCLSTYLAFVIGAYLVIVNLAYLLNKPHYRKFMSDFSGNDALVYLSGLFFLVFGLMIVTAHNIWLPEWPVLITIVGWVAIIQGVGRLLFPDQTASKFRHLHSRDGYWVISTIWLLVGCYLLYQGFCMSGTPTPMT